MAEWLDIHENSISIFEENSRETALDSNSKQEFDGKVQCKKRS